MKNLVKHICILICLVTISGNAWGAVGGALKTYDTNSSTFKTGYDRQAGDNFVWYGQKNYYGANKKDTHNGLKPTAADLPVVKAQNASATTTTTGYYWCYTSESVSNVGAIQITFSAKDGSSTVNAYVVSSSTAASSGSATWTKLTLLTGSPSSQGANVATAGTYTFTFPKETTAKYYGVVFVTSSYWRATGFQMKLLEGCTAPTAVAKGDLTSSSFGLSITDAQNAGNYDIYFSTSSIAPTASTAAASFSTVDTKTPTISSDVSASTTYYVWARSAKTVSTITYKSAWVALTGTTLTTPAAATCDYDPTIGTAELNGAFSLSSIPLQCSVSSDGGDGCTITDAGFVWESDGTDPIISDNKTAGTYSTNITGTITGSFSTSTTYKIKAYATNGHGTTLSSSSFSLTPQSVTFNSNGGSSIATKYVNSGTAVTKPSDPTKTGYTFSKWQLSGDDYNFSSTVSSNITLDAVWTAKQSTITFDKNSGTGGDNGSTGTYDSALPSVDVPTRTGYTFDGYWDSETNNNGSGTQYYKADGTSKINWDKNTTSGTTLYAKWNIINYTITYSNMDGATNHAENRDTYTIEEADDVLLQEASKTGYTFDGWFTDNGVWENEIMWIDKGSTGNVEVWAKWIAKTTTVSFNQNNGTGGQTSDKTATYDAAMPTPITVPTRTGYTFQGYYDGSGGTGTKYYNADGTSAKNWNKENSTFTLYAKWTAINYTVTWKVNGTAWTPHDPDSDPDDGKVNGSTNADYDTPWSSLTLPSDPTTSDGCSGSDKFMGWIAETLEGEVDDEDDIEEIEEKILNSSTKASRTTTKIEGNTVFHAVFADYAE